MDVEPLGIPRTPMDSSRDELGSGGQKEEFQQQNIGNSTVDYQVSIEPITDSSILANTSPVNEKQMKVYLSRHMEGVQEPILK